MTGSKVKHDSEVNMDHNESIPASQDVNSLRKLLESVKNGEISIDKALLELREEPFVDIGFAKVDTHRKLRTGASEVIYGAGKTAEQIAGIIYVLRKKNKNAVLITRLNNEKAEEISTLVGCRLYKTAYSKYGPHFPDAPNTFTYFTDSKIGIIGKIPVPDGIGRILVATGGTSDIPVAEEAALTAEFHGNEVIRLYDVGVAGLHRLLSNIDDVMDASVIIAVAGMEGALASVIGGLADCPVIAVPTSVGYGASFNGISALLSMLNSCASGVSVVNIDNGFGAGFLAGMINHPKIKE